MCSWRREGWISSISGRLTSPPEEGTKLVILSINELWHVARAAAVRGSQSLGASQALIGASTDPNYHDDFIVEHQLSIDRAGAEEDPFGQPPTAGTCGRTGEERCDPSARESEKPPEPEDPATSRDRS